MSRQKTPKILRGIKPKSGNIPNFQFSEYTFVWIPLNSTTNHKLWRHDALNVTTLCIMGLFVTLSINDTQLNSNRVPLWWVSRFFIFRLNVVATKSRYLKKMIFLCFSRICAARWLESWGRSARWPRGSTASTSPTTAPSVASSGRRSRRRWRSFRSVRKGKVRFFGEVLWNFLQLCFLLYCCGKNCINVWMMIRPMFGRQI